MRIANTYPDVTVDPHKSIRFTMQGGRAVELSGEGGIEKRTFVTLVPESVPELEESFLLGYCKEHHLRLATGFELATLRDALWGSEPEAADPVYSIAQSIALGDTDEVTGQHWFVADGFWQFGISPIEKPKLHFKIVAIRTR